MTREEAIKMLNYLATDTTGELASRYGEYAEFLVRVIDALDMAIAALREQPRWISVDERLPENKDHDWVLAQVVEDSGYAHIPKVMEYRQNRNDWYEETYGWISEHSGAFKVTHWMPLPSTEGLE